jgi:hypothetical protein
MVRCRQSRATNVKQRGLKSAGASKGKGKLELKERGLKSARASKGKGKLELKERGENYGRQT